MLKSLSSVKVHQWVLGVVFYCFIVSMIQPDYVNAQASGQAQSDSSSRNRIVFLTATQLAYKIKSGELTSMQVVKAYLDQIEKFNPRLNAIVTLDKENALARAKQADQALASGTCWGPLHGVPITIKDHFAVKGLRCTNGYPDTADYVAQSDATLVKRLKNAGAIILGKTNMPILAMDIQTFNPIFGQTNNPWDLKRTPGGSTGGGAAAVAAGLSALGIGSDLGGSIRIPSSFCGVFGFKATENIIPGTGSFPGMPKSEFRGVRHMVSIGPIARSIEDLKLGLSIIAGPDNLDVLVPPIALTPSDKTQLKQIKIAWTDNFGDVYVSNQVKQKLHDFVAQLENKGCLVEKITPDHFNFNTAWETWGIIQHMEIGIHIPSFFRFLMYSVGSFERKGIPMLAMVYPATYEKYLTALTRREYLISQLEQFFNRYDVLICPVSTTPAFLHIKPDAYRLGFPIYDKPVKVDDHQMNYWVANVSYTTPFNLTGNPVVVVPAGLSMQGLPIGLQIVGPRWKDRQLLDLAQLIYDAAGDYRHPNGF